jgi:protein transport protein SEC61 subunit alpha
MNLLATALVFVVVVVLQGFEVRLATVAKANGQPSQPYAIKLFYTSSMPIILQTALISNLNFFSQILFRRFPNNFFVNMLGQWEEREFSQNGQMYPVGGLAKYITAPQTFMDMLNDPIHALIYISFVLGTCAVLSRTWIEISKTSSRDVARRLVEEGRYLKSAGHSEDEMAHTLNKYIPTAATFGGLCIGALTIVADFLGAIGSGTGILLAVGMIQQYYETIKRDADDLDLPFLQTVKKIKFQ